MSDTQWCQLVAGTYQEQNAARYGTGPGGWAPSIGPRFVAILSAPTLDPAGRRWAACALLSPGLEPYSGSYLRSLAGLPAPAPFGLCQSGQPVDQWVSCVAPHRSQTFGTDVQQGVSASDRLASCRSLIERTTGMKDVTSGGVLRVEVVGGPAGHGNGGNIRHARFSGFVVRAQLPVDRRGSRSTDRHAGGNRQSRTPNGVTGLRLVRVAGWLLGLGGESSSVQDRWNCPAAGVLVDHKCYGAESVRVSRPERSRRLPPALQRPPGPRPAGQSTTDHPNRVEPSPWRLPNRSLIRWPDLSLRRPRRTRYR